MRKKRNDHICFFQLVSCILFLFIAVFKSSLTTANAYDEHYEDGGMMWYVDQNRTLHISGINAIPDYENQSAPWYSCRDSIQNVSFDDTINSIGNNAFEELSLTEIIIPEGITRIGKYAFESCTSLTEVLLPSTLLTIDSYAFYGCSQLSGLEIPESVIELGAGALRGTGIQRITIPENAQVSGWLLADCVNLRSVTVNGILLDGKIGTFSGCKNLNELILNDKTTSYGNASFDGCSSLTDIVYDGTKWECLNISISSTRNDPALNAIWHCTDGDVDRSRMGLFGTDSYWVLEEEGLLNVYGTGKIFNYDNQIRIPNSQIVRVKIQNGIEEVGSEAFFQCTNLESIEIPDSVNRIDYKAFYGCNSLNNIFIPSSVTFISNNAFQDCSSNLAFEAECDSFPAEWATEKGYAIYLLHISVDDAEVLPTCIESGSTAGSHCTRCNEVLTGHSVIPALGHDWTAAEYVWSEDNKSVTATRTCSRDEEHVETETVAATAEVTKAATCEGMGDTTYTSAAFQNTAFTAQSKVLTDVPALGHDWTAAEYVWSEDNKSVTATRTCSRDEEHVETETADVEYVVLSSPGEKNAGVYMLTSGEFNNQAFKSASKYFGIPSLQNMNTLRLPLGLLAIESEGFAGMNCEAVIIPDGCKTIGEKAFSGCKSLIYVSLPNGISIESSSFEGCDQAIFDYSGS